jgi:hypothetical protein
MIEDRDKLIADAAKRFGFLKDDFQYNLSLLEARDAEIARLNSVENTLKSELEDSDAEKIALSNRLNDILRKDVDRAKKHKHDREKTKQMLSELQEELETLRWSTADEISCRTREVESLKKDLRRSHMEKDDALETQRTELTHTYDKLLQAREKEFADQEKYIADQVERYHTLQTTTNLYHHTRFRTNRVFRVIYRVAVRCTVSSSGSSTFQQTTPASNPSWPLLTASWTRQPWLPLPPKSGAWSWSGACRIKTRTAEMWRKSCTASCKWWVLVPHSNRVRRY